MLGQRQDKGFGELTRQLEGLEQRLTHRLDQLQQQVAQTARVSLHQGQWCIYVWVSVAHW